MKGCRSTQDLQRWSIGGSWSARHVNCGLHGKKVQTREKWFTVVHELTSLVFVPGEGRGRFLLGREVRFGRTDVIAS